jgi:hypothetical protein
MPKGLKIFALSKTLLALQKEHPSRKAVQKASHQGNTQGQNIAYAHPESIT